MKVMAAILALALLTGCTDRKKLAELEEQHSQLKTEYEQLVEETTLKDQYIEEYTTTINEVYENLERIRKREGFLSKVSHDPEQQARQNVRRRMLSNLASIDSSLEVSKRKLLALRKKYRKAQLTIASLEKTVENLTRAVEEKEREMAELRAQVEQLNSRMAQVEEELVQKNVLLEQQSAQLNTGYYIIGTEKELKEKGIIVEEGGLFGFRKVKRLAADFDPKAFMPTDILKTEVIPIGQEKKKVQLISPHSPDSFHLVESEDKQTYLEIIDPEEFWKVRYLVILTKG